MLSRRRRYIPPLEVQELVPHQTEDGKKIYSSSWFLTISSNVRPTSLEAQRMVSNELKTCIEASLRNPLDSLTAVDEVGDIITPMYREISEHAQIELFKNKLQGMTEIGRKDRGRAVHYHGLWTVEHTEKVKLFREQVPRRIPRGLKNQLMNNLRNFTPNGQPPSADNPTYGGIKNLYVNIKYVRSPQRAVESYIMKSLEGKITITEARTRANEVSQAIVKENSSKITGRIGARAYRALESDVAADLQNDDDFEDLAEAFKNKL